MPNWLKKLKKQIVENHHWTDMLYIARYNKKRRLTTYEISTNQYFIS